MSKRPDAGILEPLVAYADLVTGRVFDVDEIAPPPAPNLTPAPNGNDDERAKPKPKPSKADISHVFEPVGKKPKPPKGPDAVTAAIERGEVVIQNSDDSTAT